MTFEDFMMTHGVSVVTQGHRHCRPGWVQLDCPQCGAGSGKYHLGYNMRGRYLHCWRCGRLPLVSTVAALTNETPKAIKAALSAFDDDAPEELPDKRGTLVLPKPLEDLMRPHRDYLRERGFDPREIAKHWGVRALGPVGVLKKPDGVRVNLAWRVFIPFTRDGETHSWTTRSLKPDATLRYISAPADCEMTNHKTMLYGEDFCGHAACAVEGPIDVWAGGFGFVGTAGTAYKREQVRRLSRFLVRGVCYDAEDEAQRHARELVEMLSVFPGKTYNFILDHKDPAEDMKHGGKDIRRIRKILGL